MDGAAFLLFLVFIDMAHAFRYGISSNLQPYMWVTIDQPDLFFFNFFYQ